MIQDLFNTRPKTFMDYEPGKIPNKKDSALQTTTHTQPQDPFASSVKIVGDDVTENDYHKFFEGFNSVREQPFWKERQFGQEQKIQKLPGRPSVDREPKIQKLPGTPLEDNGTKISIYSGVTPAYTQVKDTSQQSQQTWQDKLKEYWDNLPQSIYAANVMATTNNPLSGILRIAAGKALEDHVKKKHYERNQYNIDLPESKEDIDEWKWEAEELANCHQFTAPQNGEPNLKFVSPDGKREVIFDSDWNVVTDDKDIGTYNYASPDLRLAHGIVDVLPWIVYGNTPEDTTTIWDRIKGMLTFEK